MSPWCPAIANSCPFTHHPQQQYLLPHHYHHCIFWHFNPCLPTKNMTTLTARTWHSAVNLRFEGLQAVFYTVPGAREQFSANHRGNRRGEKCTFSVCLCRRWHFSRVDCLVATCWSVSSILCVYVPINSGYNCWQELWQNYTLLVSRHWQLSIAVCHYNGNEKL